MIHLKNLGLIVVAFSFTITACESKDDKKEEIVTTTTTNGAASNSTDSFNDKTIAGNVDGTLVSKDSAARATVGYAKPNPAKKGKKGKGGIAPASSAMQKNDNSPMEMDGEGYYNRTEVLPSFPGGQNALEKFIEDNIVYPEEAINEGVEGTVTVVFAVDENGKVYTPTTRGDKAGYGLDEEATKVVSKMPKWNPGRIKGKNVKTRFTLPVSFQIN